MKMFYKSLFSIAIFAVVSCKKENNPNIIPITIANSGTTVKISPQQTIGITLADDSAATFNAPQYNTQTLKYLSHSHQNPSTGAVGDYGTDTWEFASINKGTEPLTITATRGDSTVLVFNAYISVQ